MNNCYIYTQTHLAQILLAYGTKLRSSNESEYKKEPCVTSLKIKQMHRKKRVSTSHQGLQRLATLNLLSSVSKLSSD